LVIATLIFIAGIFALAIKNKKSEKGKITIKDLTENYHELREELQEEILSKEELKKLRKEHKKAEKNKKDAPKKNMYVINFDGDMRANAVESLREEITAVLSVAKPNDEVVVRLESPGGMAHAYGLGASQLQRIIDKQLSLTVCVDKVAASGGYMMACVANKIIAAPFAIIGSIGVLAQLPNFNRALSHHHIDYEQFTAGEYKRTVTMFGKNTAQAREKFQQQLEELHTLFKEHIKLHRPTIEIEKVATGEYWCATQAIHLGLVDALSTSDDYLLTASENHTVYEIIFATKPSLSAKLLAATRSTLQAFQPTHHNDVGNNIFF
jgi:serine protease SohB